VVRTPKLQNHSLPLELLNCSGPCSPSGFAPLSRDNQGYNLKCDCTRQTIPCSNNCFANGICNTVNGVCFNCTTSTSPPDCRPPGYVPGTNTSGLPCSSLDFCSGNGYCVNQQCNCVDGYVGPTCNALPPQSCLDYGDCTDCSASAFGCSWCLDGATPTCLPSYDARCPPSNVQLCQTTPGNYTPGPCPDNCGGHGLCQQQTGTCNCQSGFSGLNCLYNNYLLGQGSGKKGLSAGAIAGIVVGVFGGVGVGVGAAIGGYKYKQMKQNKLPIPDEEKSPPKKPDPKNKKKKEEVQPWFHQRMMNSAMGWWKGEGTESSFVKM